MAEDMRRGIAKAVSKSWNSRFLRGLGKYAEVAKVVERHGERDIHRWNFIMQVIFLNAGLPRPSVRRGCAGQNRAGDREQGTGLDRTGHTHFP